MRQPTSRRDFLRHSALAGVGFWSLASARPAHSRWASEKLNIAVVGPGGRGEGNLAGVASENIVALCEVDMKRGGAAFQQFPQARAYRDFRRMLEKEEKNIDAVVVSTPDHTHAPAAALAMRMGKHCYCEKPLTHTVYEARVLAELARQHKLATQMGTQIHAGENYRRVVEIIQAGTIGQVDEVHVWVGKGWGGGERPKETPPVPDTLDWDLWLGPAPQRPYHPCYVPFEWRRWWDFGNGTLGDMACHYMDLPFWALGLRHPSTCEAEGPPPHPETAPLGLVVRYEFPRPGQQPLRLTWYDGNRIPGELYGRKMPGAGVYFVGRQGHLFADYGRYQLFPEDQFAGFQPPEPTIPRSVGHHREWIEACKSASPTTCNFDYSGALTEAVLLGVVAYRCGQKLQWDPQRLKAVNCPAADEFLHREYRHGWTL